jgi:hypothetical protein
LRGEVDCAGVVAREKISGEILLLHRIFSP